MKARVVTLVASNAVINETDGVIRSVYRNKHSPMSQQSNNYGSTWTRGRDIDGLVRSASRISANGSMLAIAAPVLRLPYRNVVLDYSLYFIKKNMRM